LTSCFSAGVAPLAGSVDRNCFTTRTRLGKTSVAPLAASVDRNGAVQDIAGKVRGAPLAGSVDRNSAIAAWYLSFRPSLPSRGAWIEISVVIPEAGAAMSLPSRGAWIEISISRAASVRGPVAPLAGSVDRNADFCISHG